MRRRAIDKHRKTVFGERRAPVCAISCSLSPLPVFPLVLATPSRNACCPVHASATPSPERVHPRHDTWPARSAVRRAARGGRAACSFRVVGLIVDVSPCTPVTKKPEGRDERGRASERTRERERERERGRGGMHTSHFPRAARCKRRASRAHLYVSPEGSGISQGLPRGRRLEAAAGVNGG